MKKDAEKKKEENLYQKEEFLPNEESPQDQIPDLMSDTTDLLNREELLHQEDLLHLEDLLNQEETLYQEGLLHKEELLQQEHHKDHQIKDNRLQGDNLLEESHSLLDDSHHKGGPQLIPAAVHQPTILEYQLWSA